MVKQFSTLNERELEPEFQALLRELVQRVPFLKLDALQVDEPLPGSRNRADFLLKAHAGNRTWTLVAEAKKIGQPREVRNGVLQLKEYLRQLPATEGSYGLLLAPYISQESARICEEAGIGYADLAGNARLSFDQVFIETRVADNPFHEKRLVKSIFGLKASRLLRHLLQGPLRPWKVKDLAAAAKVSLGHVSSVRQQLLEQEWAREENGGLRITKPDAVLDAWAAADRWEERTTVREYSSLISEPLEIASRVHGLLGAASHAFTQWFAANLRHPHTTAPLTTVYVEEFPNEQQIKDDLLARGVDSGGRLRLVRPSDAGVLTPLQSIHGFPVVSDVQLYLDLVRAGLRGEEAASELRRWPDFAGGWS